MSLFNSTKKGTSSLTFETIKTAFPTATYENGLLTLPNNCYNDLKNKIRNLTPEMLKENFPNVVFGKMSEFNINAIKIQFPKAKNEKNTLYLPDISFCEFKDRFPDATIDKLKERFKNVEFGKGNELNYETIRAYFPRTKNENGKLLLQEIGFDDLKTIFPNLTMKDLTNKFSNIEFGKMRNININDIKKEFPNALIRNGKLVIPGIKFEDFKAKFPDASVKELEFKFPGYSFENINTQSSMVNNNTTQPNEIKSPEQNPTISTNEIKTPIETPTQGENETNTSPQTTAPITNEANIPEINVQPISNEIKEPVPNLIATNIEVKPEEKPTQPSPVVENKEVPPAQINYDAVKVATFATTDNLYLRKSPTKDSIAYLLMVPGTKVIAIGESGDWYRIIYDNFVAYCHKDYVTQCSDWKKTSMPLGKEDTYGLITAASNESMTIDGEFIKMAGNVIVENIANGDVSRSSVNNLPNKIGTVVKNDSGEAAYIIFRD